MRRRAVVAAFIVGAVLSAAVPASRADPPPDTPEQAAGKVLAALEAGDAEALKALAAKDDPGAGREE